MLGDKFAKETGATGISACWSCKGPVSSLAPFCHTCGAVQPPSAVDHFRRMGFEAEFDVDQELLERRYIGFQRHLHPDRFVTKSPKERALAQSQAVSLNQAYETLKDPLRRAQYLLECRGAGLDGETAQTVDDKALLMDVMEKREALAGAPDAATVERLTADAGAEALGLLAALSKAFATGDLAAAGRLVTRLKYTRKFLEETRARLVSLATV